MQNRAVLASVEMTPTALGLMIMEPALGAALGTAPAHLFIVFEEDMDFAAALDTLQAKSEKLLRDLDNTGGS